MKKSKMPNSAVVIIITSIIIFLAFPFLYKDNQLVTYYGGIFNSIIGGLISFLIAYTVTNKEIRSQITLNNQNSDNQDQLEKKERKENRKLDVKLGVAKEIIPLLWKVRGQVIQTYILLRVMIMSLIQYQKCLESNKQTDGTLDYFEKQFDAFQKACEIYNVENSNFLDISLYGEMALLKYSSDIKVTINLLQQIFTYLKLIEYYISDIKSNYMSSRNIEKEKINKIIEYFNLTVELYKKVDIMIKMLNTNLQNYFYSDIFDATIPNECNLENAVFKPLSWESKY